MASKMSMPVPHPARQGGVGKSPVQGALVQKKSGPVKPGKSEIKYSSQPGGTRGTGTERGVPGKGVK